MVSPKLARCSVKLSVLALLLGGCWDWSFPDDPPGDLGPSIDMISTGDRDLPMVNDEGGAGTVCDGETPIVEGDSCRACQNHEECESGGGLCLVDGSCPVEDEITYVDEQNCNDGVKDGSPSEPYCTINDAVAGSSNKYILVRQGVYDQTVIGRDLEIYGEDYDPGGVDMAQLLSSNDDCKALVIKGGATVHISGFKIGNDSTLKTGGVLIENDGTKATLEHNIIGPSQCIGVEGKKDTTIELERNLIHENTLGGIRLVDVESYTVMNNFILNNGTLTTSLGGAHLKAVNIPALFINNTVTGNKAMKGRDGGPSGIKCEGISTSVLNSIVWDNTTDDDADPLKDQHKSCMLNFCNARDAVGLGNMSMDPLFVSDDDYHLKSGSPLRDKGLQMPDTPTIDFDGDPRDSQPDIGADEIL